MSISDQWYIKTKSGQRGPYSLAQLQRYVDAGALRPNAGVGDGRGQWVAAMTVQGLTFSADVMAEWRRQTKRTSRPPTAEAASQTAPPTDASPPAADSGAAPAQPPADPPPTDNSATPQAELDARAAELERRATELDARQRELAQLEQQLQQARAEAERLQPQQQRIADAEQRLAEQEAQFQSRRGALDQQQRQLDQQHRELEQQRGELDQQHRELEQQRGRWEQQQAALRRERTEQEHRAAELKSREAELARRQRETTEAEDSLRQRETALEERQRVLDEQQDQLSEQQEQVAQQQEQLAQQREAFDEHRQQLDAQRGQLEEQQQRLRERETELQSREQQWDNAAAKVQSLEQAVEQLREERSTLEQQLEAAQTELAALREAADANLPAATADPTEFDPTESDPAASTAEADPHADPEEVGGEPREPESLWTEKKRLLREFADRQESLARREAELMRRERELTRRELDIAERGVSEGDTPEASPLPRPQQPPAADEQATPTENAWHDVVRRRPRMATPQVRARSAAEPADSPDPENAWEPDEASEAAEQTPKRAWRRPAASLALEFDTPAASDSAATDPAAVESSGTEIIEVGGGAASDAVEFRRHAYQQRFGPCQRYEIDRDTAMRVDVSIHEPSGNRDFTTLVTSGMSDHPLVMPGGQRSVRAELLIYVTHVDETAIAVLREAAKWPLRNQQSVSIGTTGSLADATDRLEGGKLRDCVYMLPVAESDAKPIPAQASLGSSIQLFWLVAITDAERKLIETGGIHKFLSLLEKNQHAGYFDWTRDCYVKRKGWFRR